MRFAFGRFLSEEKGQGILMVLILLCVGGLIIAPLLSYMSTALKTGMMYKDKTDELYATDSGVEDAIWQIKYERLDSLLTDPAYDPYDFSANWTYDISEQINGKDTTIQIENVWIPKDISPLNKTEGRAIIENGKLIIAGNALSDSDCKIKVFFYPDEGEEDDLMIETLGIWLPLGFSYTTGSSNLEADPIEDYYSVPNVQPHSGGQSVVWSFESVPYTSFPDVDPQDTPMSTEITFQYSTNQTGQRPVTVSWIVTSGVSDVPLSWDADAKVYQITSMSGDTQIEAYTVNCGLRKLGSAIEGDYRAIGNSLMIDTIPDSYDIRDEVLDESDAEVSDFPLEAEVVAAYLYWSGWFAEGTIQPIWEDDCSDFSDWDNPGIVWGLSSGSFRGHYNGSDPQEHRYLTMINSLDLSSYTSGRVKVSWEHWEEDGYQLESSDALQFQFSYDGGNNWGDIITAFSNDIGSSPQSFRYTIPDQYLTDDFKMRFYLKYFGGSGEYCYIDNFAVQEVIYTADTSIIFKINDEQVYLDGDGLPQMGNEEITAYQSSILENEPGEYSYACYRDVTRLVREFSDEGDYGNHTGNGTYTVGNVDADTGEHWSYAGWSLLIVYSSPETAGHQLYLYDEFAFNGGDENLDFDGDGQPGGSITGFIVPEPIGGEENAATLTCFVGEGDDVWTGDYLAFNGTQLSDGAGSLTNVWDSQSVGMSEDGVDIDTFYITWASGLLEPGASTAQLDMITTTDNWNLIYIILSLRSEMVVGGTEHYLIQSN